MGKKRLSTAEKKARAAKRKARAERRRGTAAPVRRQAADAAILGAMLREEGLEEITPALVEELVSERGWTRAAVDEALALARDGFRYHRGRNSLFGPPETSLDALDGVGDLGAFDEDDVFVDADGVIHDPLHTAAAIARRLGAVLEPPAADEVLSFADAVAHVHAARRPNVAAYTFLPRRHRDAVIGGEVHVVAYDTASEQEPDEYPPVSVEYVAGEFGSDMGEEDSYDPADAPSEVQQAPFRLTDRYDAGFVHYVPEYLLQLLAGRSKEEADRVLDG